MYIKSVILEGFKSYGQRTEITGFDPLFNAITGLNGSGKSNILDAICFVLGITNLSHVRVGNLQDLIYKSGQCGINKATVSITFDNSNPNQCPPGFENLKEITVSRKIVMGGKNNYLLNGLSVPNKKIQDLFCSVQLNVNNPHFLIMQGKITKVLNMKPYDILAMIEEAAGTKMYELKKERTQKTIKDKDDKMKELMSVIKEELEPKLNKLRAEREKYMEYKQVERTLNHMMLVYQAWEYLSSRKSYDSAVKAVEQEEIKIEEIQDEILNHKNEIKQTDQLIQELMKKAESEGNGALQNAETELRAMEKSQAKVNATIKSVTDEIKHEKTRKNELEKNLIDDEKALKSKETELSKVQSMFLELKQSDERDTHEFQLARKRFEALSAGMELNEEGEAETLQLQLMTARQEAAKANTEIKQATMRLKFCQDQLKERQQKRVSNANEMAKEQQEHDRISEEVKRLDAELKKLSFDEGEMAELQNRRVTLLQEVRRLRDRVDSFEAQRPHTQFRYNDPEPGFNRNRVDGVVCRLFKVKHADARSAIETAAGGRLYNVVIDTDATGKKLLQNGALQRRITFIPINQIQGRRMGDNIVKLAQDLVGRENVQPALSHLSFDKRLQPVMDFVFGNTFICKDISVARRVANHDRIMRKCITLDGDSVDPAGVMSGGARQKGAPVLQQLAEIIQCEVDLEAKEQELQHVETRIRELSGRQAQFTNLREQLDMKQHDLALKKQCLQRSSHYKQQEELATLQSEVEELKEKISTCQENEVRFKERAKELERTVKNKGGRDEQIKQAEKDMNKLKTQADKSKKQWQQKEQYYDALNLEIEELKKSLETTQQQIVTAGEAIEKLKKDKEEIVSSNQELNDNIAQKQAEVKQEKAKMTQKNKEIERKAGRKEELQNLITDCEIKIKEHDHSLKKLKDDCKSLKTRQGDCEKRVKKDNLKEAEKMSEQEGTDLEKEIRKSQDLKHALGRTINSKAQTLFEQQEKEYNELKKKYKMVELDKKKLMLVIEDLDRKKEQILSKAYDQISRDFGSIFSTLLPGANAKLVAPTGQTILQGIEIKVSLGGVWKDSLTELSGGQRSLAALSLILAMLLFKPAPMYILDEVDAALDLSHTQNIGQMLKTHFQKSQFIVVSLKDGMFSNANVLFRTQFVDGMSTITRIVNRH